MKPNAQCAVAALTLFCLMFLVSIPLFADHRPPVVETIAQGSVSYYRYGDLNFTGADLVITEPRAWEWFWSLHTAGIMPAPPLPDVDFERDLVIVTILGTQRTGGAPRIDILDVDLDHDCNCFYALIQDDTTPGPIDVITNPFHIIKATRLRTASVLFEHQKP